MKYLTQKKKYVNNHIPYMIRLLDPSRNTQKNKILIKVLVEILTENCV